MSGLLFGVGAVAVLAGAVLVGFGIPINEFSFGNTLIITGVTAAVGGLIVVGLGMVVAQLQRLTEALGNRAPMRANRPAEMFESAPGARAAAPAGRVPFPPKTRADTGNRETYLQERHMAAAPYETHAEDNPSHFAPPMLRNPEESQHTVEEEVSLSPQHPMAAPAAHATDAARHAPAYDAADSDMPGRRGEAAQDSGWRSGQGMAPTRAPHTAYFDAMWPAEPKTAEHKPAEYKPAEPKPARALFDRLPAEPDTKFDSKFDDKFDNKFDPKPDADAYEPRFDTVAREREQVPAPAMRGEPEAAKPRATLEPRAVAILKSGVVDGMGYTLYVDGSIEAELPQGTLRFASINDLRSHLEKSA